MKKNQEGFSVIEGLLILIIVGIVGFVGWYVRQEANKPEANNQTSSNQQTSEESQSPIEPKDETASWTSFTPNSKFYTVKLPDGWTFLHQNDECDCLHSQTTNFAAGTSATIGKTQGGRDGIFGYFIVVDDSDKSGERFNNFQKQGTIKAGDFVGDKYYFEQTTESEGIGLDKGSKEYAYYFAKDTKRIYISFYVNPGEADNTELIEKSIKTLR